MSARGQFTGPEHEPHNAGYFFNLDCVLAVELIMNTTVIHTFWSDDSGATMVEYGLMVALIAVAALTAITAFGRGINEGLFKVAAAMFEA